MSEALYFVSHEGTKARRSCNPNFFVIPAKAGIHHLPFKFRLPVMAPRLRGGDEVGTISALLRVFVPSCEQIIAPIGAGRAL
jgi:hypothetical protein